MAFALCGCVAPVAGASADAPSTITQISLERDCNGCPAGTRLVLRRDGTATYTEVGKARLGSADKVSTGSVRAEDFDALAQLAVSRGFFSLSDSYDDPQLRDGSWTTLIVTRDGQEKRVFRREDAGPLALKAIEAAVDGVKAKIRFAP